MKLSGFIALIFLFCNHLPGQPSSGFLTKDGAWCWFSDPRAIIVDHYLIAGWVKSDGSIESIRFDLTNQTMQTSELYYKLETDDHNNPAFVLTGNGQILAMYTRHNRKDLFINRLPDYNKEFTYTGAQLLHPISSEELEKFPRATMTYANPFRLKQEKDKIYCFGRWTGFKPNFIYSEDDGLTWTKAKVFITNDPFTAHNRPYVKYFSDGISKIHIVFTDGHPRDEPTNSVYYAYYQGNRFHRVTGEVICDFDNLPFQQKDASTVFAGNEAEGRAWIADIGQDSRNNPVILYTKSRDEQNHEYWYSRYNEGHWVHHKICNSGKWFPRTPVGKNEPEPHYFGGMAVHPDNAEVVYVSRQIDGIFEIERWETKDLGNSWITEPITQHSLHDNVRPYLPLGLKRSSPEVVVWMENQEYIHFRNFKASIRYNVREIK